MYQNTKKMQLTRNRWSDIVEFIHSNDSNIKSMLLSAICPEMIRADILLDNITEGSPSLFARTIVPDGLTSVYVYSFLRPKLFYPKIIERQINTIPIEDILIFIANQVDLV